MIARGERRIGILMIAPAVVILGTVTAYPGLRVLWLSLERRVPVFGIDEFVGLANYRFLLSDPAFWNAVRVTLTFTTVSVALEMALGLLVALALRHLRRGKAIASALLLLPWCLPGVVTARTWEWLFHPTAGLVNRVLGWIPIDPLGGRPINWLGDPTLALAAAIVADVWRTMPFVALLCYARLLTIPPEVYEAAGVDGAGRVTTFRAITLPLLMPALVIALLFRTLDALRAFDLVFVLTGGGPAATTETLTLYAYRSLFQTLQLGFGAAASTIVFAAVAVTAWAYLKALDRAEVEA